MAAEAAPLVCGRCEGTTLIRILWNYSELDDEATNDVTSHRAILGLNHHYFKALERDGVMTAIRFESTALPRNGCLTCTPKWQDLHELMLSEYRAELAKWTAFNTGEFENAAFLLQIQKQLFSDHIEQVRILLQEILASVNSQ